MLSYIQDEIGLQTAKYCTVGAAALMVYDYLVTLKYEARWMMGRKWTITRVAFTLARYLPWPCAFMTGYAALRNNGIFEPGFCINWSLSSGVLHVFSIAFAEGLLIIRVYAFWGRKWVLYSLLFLAVMEIIADEVISHFLPLTAQETPGPSILVNQGACVFESPKISAMQYGFLVFYQLVMLVLILIKRLGFYRGCQSKLVITLYRDGLIYIGCIIALSLANIIAIVALPYAYNKSMELLQVVLHSIIASRILFNLRSTDHKARAESLTSDMALQSLTQLRFS